jgi:DMSO/TMAO reductase YedYZ molybdopterin-dependent catalytic subunit
MWTGQYKLVIDGPVEHKLSWTLGQLYALPQETQCATHLRRRMERRWQWTGTPLAQFYAIGADLTAKYVHCLPGAILYLSTYQPLCILRRR